MRNILFFNCNTSDLKQTLGVMFYNRQLLQELSEHWRVFLVHNRAAADPSLVDLHDWGFVAGILSSEQARAITMGWGGAMVELIAHQFQPRMLNIPSVVMIFDLHVFDIAWKYHRGDFAARLTKLCAESTVVTTMFPRTYYDLEQHVGFNIQNFFLLESPLLVKPMRGSAGMQRGRARTGSPHLLYPAQFQIHKNHAGLLRGLAKAVHNGIDAHLTLVGSDLSTHKKPHRQTVETLARELGIADRVSIEGHVSDERLQILYSECDGLVIPSLAEGGGYVALEGIYAGIPVASNSLRSTRLHVKQFGGFVEFFDSTNVDETAAAIRWVAECDREAQFHINEPCRDAIDSVSWSRAARGLNRILEFAVGARPRPRHAVSPGDPLIEFIE